MCKTLCIFTGLGLASAGRARDPERKLGAHIPGVSLVSPRVSGKREPGSGPELEAPASKRDGEEHVRDNCELVDGRPTSPAGACAEDLATVLVERVHNVSIYWQTNSSMAASVPRAQCQCWSRERAEANGSQAARCRSHRKQAAHYLAAALTISTAAPQARVKAPMRGTVTAKYWATAAIYGEALGSNSDLSCCRVAPDSA